MAAFLDSQESMELADKIGELLKNYDQTEHRKGRDGKETAMIMLVALLRILSAYVVLRMPGASAKELGSNMGDTLVAMIDGMKTKKKEIDHRGDKPATEEGFGGWRQWRR